MNYAEKNKQIIERIKQINENLSDLYINGSNLIFNGKTIDISSFDVSLLLTEQNPLVNDLSFLTSEDIFNIIRIHAINTEIKKTEAIDKNKTELEMLKQRNPLLKNVTISTRKNDSGYDEEYINIVDSNGFDRVLHNYYKIDLIQLYKEALETYKTSDITPEQLYDIFRRRCKEVDLEKANEVYNKNRTSEQFKSELNNYNEQHFTDSQYSLVNEQHNIIVGTDHTITTYETDKKGNLVQKNFDNSINPYGNNDDLVNNEQNVNVNDDIQINQQNSNTFINLISEEKFYFLINSPNALSKEETEQVALFNSYMEQLIIYRKYLLSELKEILNRYEYAMNAITLMEEEALNNNQSEQINKYKEILELCELKQNEALRKNPEAKIKRLILEKPKKEEGFISTMVISLLVAVGILIISIIAFVVTH